MNDMVSILMPVDTSIESSDATPIDKPFDEVDESTKLQIDSSQESAEEESERVTPFANIDTILDVDDTSTLASTEFSPVAGFKASVEVLGESDAIMARPLLKRQNGIRRLPKAGINQVALGCESADMKIFCRSDHDDEGGTFWTRLGAFGTLRLYKSSKAKRRQAILSIHEDLDVGFDYPLEEDFAAHFVAQVK